MKNSCVEISMYGEKNYRLFLDIIKQELDKMGVKDINAIQAFILMNINENTITKSEVISRGYYVGSNASYNLKKMINNGYMEQNQSNYDKRTAYLRLTDKGLNLYERLDAAIKLHVKSFESSLKGKFGLTHGVDFLKNVEHFWKEILLRRT